MRQQRKITKQTLLILAFFIIRLFAISQNSNRQIESHETKKLIIKIDIDKKAQKERIEPYIAFNYDFGDSISIYENDKEIFRTKLMYQRPDSNSEFFPYCRKLIRLHSMTNSNHLDNTNCRLIFWKSKRVIEFNLHRNATYYVFGLDKDALKWHLNVSNVYPWPD